MEEEDKENTQNTEEKNNTFKMPFWAILLIIVVVIGIIIYIASLGTVNISKVSEKKKEETKLERLKRRHEKLKEVIQKKKNLLKRLNRWFRVIYFFVRVGLVAIYLGYNALLYYQFGITDLGDILNWNELAIIIIALCSFITFSTLLGVKEFIEKLRYNIEIWVYKKYVPKSLRDAIEKNISSLESVSVEIALQEKISIELNNDDNESIT